MMKLRFVDSNIIIYANDCRAGPKQTQAIALIQDLMRSRSGVISTRGMQEYADVAPFPLSCSPFPFPNSAIPLCPLFPSE